MSTRIRFTATDPQTAARIRATLDAGPIEREASPLPKATPIDHLKKWKIQALAARSKVHSEGRTNAS